MMDIRNLPIIPTTRLCEAAHVSRDTIRKRIEELVDAGAILPPVRTPTNRDLLSIAAVEVIAKSF